MYAMGIASALNLVSHLLLLLRVDAAAMLELHTSLTFLHQLNADHVVSVTCSIQAFKLTNAVWHMTAYIVKLVEPDFKHVIFCTRSQPIQVSKEHFLPIKW